MLHRTFAPLALAVVAMTVTGAFLAISSGPASAQETVAVSLQAPFVISAVPPSVADGSVIFQATNDGVNVHNLRVIKTDLAPDGLPVSGGQADEAQLNVVASTADLAAGQSESTPAIDMQPGNYVLICNVPAHYQSGMYLGFQVTPAVGGVAELPEVAGAPLQATASSGGNAGLLAGVIAAVVAGAVALGGAAWYVRRRPA
ncbi:MAG: hypothetical protein IIC26_06125 [Chloroflexi bacterium]|nr:hypothetical protein [Chloroflexota bacterium]